MDQDGLEQAKRRLKKCDVALAAIRGAKVLDELDEGWTDFITAASTIYSKLGQAVKGNGAAEAWFGRMNHERKTDELLAYIHHARNIDEHGIVHVAERAHGNFTVTQDVPGPVSFKIKFGPGYPTQLTQWAGDPVKVNQIPARLMLVPVRDRGVLYAVPTCHAGAAIAEATPERVAELAYAYLTQMVADASAL